MNTGIGRKRLLTIRWGATLFIALLVLVAWLTPLQADDDEDFVPDQVVVKLNLAGGATIAAINATYGTTILDTLLGSAGIYLLQIAPGQNVEGVVQAMAGDPHLLFAEPNFMGEMPEGDPRGTWAWGGYDPEPYFGQYAADMLNLAEAHAVTMGADVVVAVLDTGVQLGHPRLANRFTAARYDFIADDALPEDEANGLDDDSDSEIDEGTGHGTHVAGVINLVAPEAQIMPLRVLDSDGVGNDFLIAEAIQYAVANGAGVINLSLGTSAESELLEEIIENAVAEEIVVVAAAGNLNTSTEQYPAASEDVLAVTSIGPAYVKSSFANYGTWVDIATPGESITSTFPLDGYAQWSGTSMATAFISGQAILIRSASPAMAVTDISELIRSTSRPLNEFNSGYHDLLGVGVADIGTSLSPGAAAVSCGQVLTTTILLAHDLLECPGDGLVVGADGITVDLNGHTIDGIGLGVGIRNDGFDQVSMTNGIVQEFDYGVQLNPGTALNIVSLLTLQLNQEAGIQLSDADDGVNGNMISQNTISGNSAGITLVDGTTGTVVRNNSLGGNSNYALRLAASSGNRIEANLVTGSSDLAVLFEGSSDNTLLGNTISDSSDGALAVLAASNGNRIEGNTLTASGDAGIRVVDSNGNELIGNTVHDVGDTAIIVENGHNNRIEGNTLTEGGDAGIYIAGSVGNELLFNTIQHVSDSGIVLNDAHDGVVRGNDLRFNAGGIELGTATGNLIESNDASHSTGTGISLEAESLGNVIVLNAANFNGAGGISVEAETLPESTEPGNLLDHNTVSGNNVKGIYVGKAGHTITANTADNNNGWGIYTAVGNTDGGGNSATGNSESLQCLNVACNGSPPVPPTATATPVPPTVTATPTETPLPPTATALPTNTPAPPTATHTPTATPVPPAATHTPTATPLPVTCTATTLTLTGDADAWIDQNSSSNNFGADSILKVQSKGPSDNFRALVHFALPASMPQGCVIQSATLRLYAPSWKNGRTLQALRVASGWSENTVTWNNQPQTTGPAATTTSGSGYRVWNVTAQVQAMYDTSANHGFLIRDAVEGADAEQQLHSREKGESLPTLIISFASPGG